MKKRNLIVNKNKILSIALGSIVLLSSSNLIGCGSKISAIPDSTIDAANDNLKKDVYYCLVDFGDYVKLLTYKNYTISYNRVRLILEDDTAIYLDLENVMFVDGSSEIQVALANEILNSNNQEETVPYQKKKAYEQY